MQQLLSTLFERRRASDRRRFFRGGRRAGDVCRLAVLTWLLHIVSASGASAAPVQFGLDMPSVPAAAKRGANISYGVFWAGAWTQKFGWADATEQLNAARKAGVTPVVNWWYWGDDISPSCVENGCEDRRQHVHKDRATWSRMSNELASLISKTMGDRDAIVVLETEFNKNGIEQSAAFDGYLAEQEKIFHSKGHIRVVLGFGNWGREHWNTFSRAIEGADLLGTQLLQSSVRDASSYLHAVDTLVTGARYLQTSFHKPVLIVDLALSSYPSGRYEEYQATVMRELFNRLPELGAAGVRGIIWRSLADDPKFDTSNYHGEAERYWGLIRADGSTKPALATFIEGVRAERGNAGATLTAPQ